MADVASLHEVGNRADRVLDRHVRVEARGTIDVDVVDAEPLQRVGCEGLHRGRPGVEADPAGGRIAQRAELDADDRLVAMVAVGKRLADQHLVVAHAVEVAGVDQRHAGIERGVDRGDALGAVGRTVEVRHAHAAEAECRNDGTGLAQLTSFHGRVPFVLE